MECLVCGWLLYGNVLIYSEQNNCGDYNPLLAYLMMGIIFLGYFHLLIYLVVIVMVIVFVGMRIRDKRKKKMASVNILQSLSRTKFSSILYETENECIICWAPYEQNDDVIKLKCNEKHLYH